MIGLLEAFSAEPYGFNDTDVVSLELLAELILAALKPEDEDRFALSAQVAEAELGAPMQTAAEFSIWFGGDFAGGSREARRKLNLLRRPSRLLN